MHYQRLALGRSGGQRVRAAPADVMAEAPHAYETWADYYVYIYTVIIRCMYAYCRRSAYCTNITIRDILLVTVLS